MLNTYLLLMLKIIVTFRPRLWLSILEASATFNIMAAVHPYFKTIGWGLALLHLNTKINQLCILIPIYHCHHVRKKICLPISPAELKWVLFNLFVMKTWTNGHLMWSSRWDWSLFYSVSPSHDNHSGFWFGWCPWPGISDPRQKLIKGKAGKGQPVHLHL